MSREEFIGKLQMVYVGDRNAFNDIVCAYDSVLSANEKAIEYIKENNCPDPYCLTKDLLNILQNGSDSK